MFQKTRKKLSNVSADLKQQYKPSNIREQAQRDYEAIKPMLDDDKARNAARKKAAKQRQPLYSKFAMAALIVLIVWLLAVLLG